MMSRQPSDFLSLSKPPCIQNSNVTYIKDDTSTGHEGDIDLIKTTEKRDTNQYLQDHTDLIGTLDEPSDVRSEDNGNPAENLSNTESELKVVSLHSLFTPDKESTLIPAVPGHANLFTQSSNTNPDRFSGDVPDTKNVNTTENICAVKIENSANSESSQNHIHSDLRLCKSALCLPSYLSISQSPVECRSNTHLSALNNEKNENSEGTHTDGCSANFQNKFSVRIQNLRLLSVREKSGTRKPALTNLMLPKNNQSEYDKFMSRLSQHEMSGNHLIYKIYLLQNSLRLCGLLAIFFFFVGSVILVSSNSIKFKTFEYTTKDDLAFSVNTEWSHPIYIYYMIDGYYGNYKETVSDLPSYLSIENSCSVIKTQQEALDFRLVNGVQTLPWLQVSNVTGEAIPADQESVRPCGLASTSIFNDNFTVIRNDNTIISVRSHPQNSFLFPTYMAPNSTFSGFIPWYLTNFDLYRSWTLTPYNSKFMKPIGILDENLKIGSYTFRVEESNWPATSWRAQKSYVISTASFVGFQSFQLSYISFASGILALSFCIILPLLARYFNRSKQN